MKNITYTLGNKAQISRLTPYQQEEGNIEKLAAVIRGAVGGIGKPYIRFQAEKGAPIGIVFQKLAAKTAENSGVEGVNIIRGWRQPHLSIGKMQDNMFPLVFHIGRLKTKEKSQPIQEVIVRMPWRKRRSPEISNRF